MGPDYISTKNSAHSSNYINTKIHHGDHHKRFVLTTSSPGRGHMQDRYRVNSFQSTSKFSVRTIKLHPLQKVYG